MLSDQNTDIDVRQILKESRIDMDRNTKRLKTIENKIKELEQLLSSQNEQVTELMKDTTDTEKSANRLKNVGSIIPNVDDLNGTISPKEVDTSSSSNTPKRFCDMVQELTSASTLHGLSNIVTARYTWVKLFWIILMAAGFGLAGWQLVAIFTEYFQFPVFTEVGTHRGNVTFPHITICNKNGYILSKADEHMKLGFPHSDIRNLKVEERIMMSFNLTEFLLIDSGIESKLFPTIENGNCYILRANQSMKEPRLEFNVIVNINQEESLNMNVEDGATVYIREPGIYPISDKDSYVDVRPGESVEIGITLETINRLGGKYGNCQDDVQRFLEAGVNYSQDLCERLCPFCDCKPRCRMMKYGLSVKTSKLPNIEMFESRVCQAWSELCKKDNTFKKRLAKGNIVALIFRVDNTEHKVYTQTPTYPLSRFLSDVGGTLGLFVGVSLLTLFELPQLIIVSVMFLIRMIRKERK